MSGSSARSCNCENTEIPDERISSAISPSSGEYTIGWCPVLFSPNARSRNAVSVPVRPASVTFAIRIRKLAMYPRVRGSRWRCRTCDPTAPGEEPGSSRASDRKMEPLLAAATRLPKPLHQPQPCDGVVPTGENAAHHLFISTLRRRQVVEDQ